MNAFSIIKTDDDANIVKVVYEFLLLPSDNANFELDLNTNSENLPMRYIYEELE